MNATGIVHQRLTEGPVAKRFDPAKHPRDDHGRWIKEGMKVTPVSDPSQVGVVTGAKQGPYHEVAFHGRGAKPGDRPDRIGHYLPREIAPAGDQRNAGVNARTKDAATRSRIKELEEKIHRREVRGRRGSSAIAARKLKELKDELEALRA